MAQFISTYQGIGYKVPESDKVAKFERGRLSTNDEQVVSYLREHQDYGSTLTEVESSSGAMAVDVHFCPVEGCDFVSKTAQGLAAHMKVHKKDDGSGDGAGSETK